MRQICLLALAGWLTFSGTCRAGLTINLRFADGTTTKKLTSAAAGQDFLVQAWATIDTQSGAVGTGDLYGLKYSYFSVLSERLTAGPNGSINGSLVNSTLQAPFNGTGSQTGSTADRNADGINDLGGLEGDANNTFIFTRSNGDTFSNTPGITGQAITNGFEFLVQTFKFRVADFPATVQAGAGTKLSPFVPVHTAVPGVATGIWWQKSTGEPPGGPVSDGRNLDDAFHSAGTSVSFLVGSAWQNPLSPLDVDANTRIEPLDVLQVVNDLNANGIRQLPAPGAGQPPPYLDTTGDGNTSPQDALLIINYLNSLPGGLSAEVPTMADVPEPSSGLLALTLALGGWGMRRKLRNR